ncbi:MAG: ABC transporter permease [Anaerolineae bacterium]|nr:ABC transporter permease [Anaerolineae bacterium]
MTNRHMMAIARKEWLHITRDPMTIFLLAIGPVLMLILVSYAMATDVENVPTVIYDLDQSELSGQLADELDATNVLDVQGYVSSEAAYQDKLERRKTKLVVIIEEGFGEQISTLDGLMSLETAKPKFSFVIDGTDPISAETALEAAMKTSEAFVTGQLGAVLDEQQAAGMADDLITLYRLQLESPINTTVENRYNPDLKAIWDLVPAMIAVALVLPGMSISTVIARERSEGTLEALVATPINKHAILLGKSLPYMITSLINVCLMYVVARVVFDVPFRGSLPLYLLLSALYAFATLSIGLLFSILIPSMEAALWASMMFFLFPGVLLSGMFFPVDVFPFLVKIETIELPVVSGVIINRGMFLQGVGARELWWNIVVLLIIALEGFEIAGRLFKKRIA